MSRPYDAPELHVVDDLGIQPLAGRIVRKLAGDFLPHPLLAGDIVQIDTTQRDQKRGWVAVRIDGRELLGRFEPGLGRPKYGPLELWLGATNDEGDWPGQRFEVTPEFLERHVIGHLAGHYEPDAPVRSKWTVEDEAAVLARIKDEDDAWIEEERQADDAAIKARYRARAIAEQTAPLELRAPDRSRDQLHAPEGSFELDTITRKLLNQGRICYIHLAENPFACARGYVLSFATTARGITQLRSEVWPTQRRTAGLIATRIDEMLQSMNDFIKHVRYEDTGYFISQEELDSDPSDEKEDATALAESRLGDARDAVQLAICKLQAFWEPFQR